MLWTETSSKQLFLICDAPGHGKDLNDFNDNHPSGSPEGYTIQNQMKIFADKKINLSVIRVNNKCDKMIEVMKANYDTADLKLNVSDLQQALLKKSAAEVTKDFVNAASFILSAAVGIGKKAVKTENLWDPKQIAIGQYLS